jgi:hypothetical protein
MNGQNISIDENVQIPLLSHGSIYAFD